MDIRSPTKWLITLAYILLLVAAILLSPGVALAQGSGPLYDEAEALAIDRMLMCPVCPAETIDQAQVELSQQMRRTVREMLAQGTTRDEILRFLSSAMAPAYWPLHLSPEPICWPGSLQW